MNHSFWQNILSLPVLLPKTNHIYIICHDHFRNVSLQIKQLLFWRHPSERPSLEDLELAVDSVVDVAPIALVPCCIWNSALYS